MKPSANVVSAGFRFRSTQPTVLADQGLKALAEDPGLAKALNTHQGYISCKPVAEAYSLLERYRLLS